MPSIPPILPGNAITGAYSSSKKLDSSLVGGVSGSGGGFESLVQKAAADAVDTIRQGDKAIQDGLSGKLGIQAVVEATMAMENTVKVSISLRDKLVSAYQEILRMPI